MVFSNIIGQPKAVKLLSRAMTTDRLAHAYLFSGPDGVGKTTTAITLAAALFCEQTERSGPCGHCGGCVKFSSGNHPDFLTIRAQGAAIRIQQIRELKKKLSFSPFESGLRVVLMEDIQTMRREAGNSLLKILEEPPPDNLLLLIASDSEPVLPTIVSRCQVIPFLPLTIDQSSVVVGSLYPELSGEEARSLSVLSGGCPGQVQARNNEEVLRLRNECIQAVVEPGNDRAKAVELGLDLAGRMADLKEGLETLFDLLALFFKESMVVQLGGTENPETVSLAAPRERWNLQQLSDKILAVEAARRQLARNGNKGLVCEVLMLDLCK